MRRVGEIRIKPDLIGAAVQEHCRLSQRAAVLPLETGVIIVGQFRFKRRISSEERVRVQIGQRRRAERMAVRRGERQRLTQLIRRAHRMTELRHGGRLIVAEIHAIHVGEIDLVVAQTYVGTEPVVPRQRRLCENTEVVFFGIRIDGRAEISQSVFRAVEILLVDVVFGVINADQQSFGEPPERFLRVIGLKDRKSVV